jgi:hypothetical protein
MDMGTAGALKNSGDKDFIIPEPGSANRADPEPFPFKTISAALNVHKPVRTGKRGVGHGFYQLPLFQPGGTNRTGLGRAGYPGSPGMFFSFHPPAEPKTDRPQGFKKQGIPEPEQRNPQHHKD